MANVANDTCTPGQILSFGQSCTVKCDNLSDFVNGTTNFTCSATGTNFTYTPSIVCMKRCDYPTSAQLIANNFVNVACNVDGVNNFGYGQYCNVTCDSNSDPHVGGVQQYQCSPSGNGTLIAPTACIKSMCPFPTCVLAAHYRAWPPVPAALWRV